MSTVSELPDESWSEEKILELLNQNISGSSARQEVRLVCLDELRKRRKMKRVDAVMEVLLKMAKVRCRSTPESSMIVELISRLANLEESAFHRLLNTMISMQDDLLYCFAKIIRNLEDAKKKICIPRLLSFLMKYDSFTNITDEMYRTLVGVENKDIKKDILKATLPYLKTADPFKVVYAVKITSKLASELISELELVTKRALNGWYDGHKEEILKNICNYLGRIKDEKSIPYLLQILRSGFENEVVPTALASIIDTHPKTIKQIWEFLEKEKKHYPSMLEAFAEMETSIDLERLLSVVDIDLNKWRPKAALKKIMIKAGERAKPLLFEMVKNKNEVRYTFAVECLEEIRVSIEEYSKVFEKSPVLQLYEFFYEQKKGMLLENLWKEQDKLRNPLKKKYMRFEYFIQNLFSAFGFVTLFVDPSGKEGVDLIAFAPNKPYILIIGCTTSVLKNDLEKLNMTLNEMEDALVELFEKYRILPIVIMSRKVEVTSSDSEYAGRNNIAILTQEETTTLLKMLRTNRRSEEIIKQIEQWIPTVQTENPYA